MSRRKGICGVIDAAAWLCPRVDSSRFRHQRAPGGVLLYDVAADTTLETNEVGLEILRKLDGQHTCRQIAEHLAARYSQPAEVMQADVSEFLQTLERQGFLEHQ
jgi:hypothetical protein